MVTEDSAPQGRANTDQEENEFECRFCDTRPFTSKRGLGQHMRLKHVEEYNRQINVERTKYRWTTEEEDRMACEEAKASRDKVRYMNQHMLSKFPNRTLEAVKAKRKSDTYKQKVVDASARLSEAPARAMVQAQDVEVNRDEEPEDAQVQAPVTPVVSNEAEPDDTYVQALKKQIQDLCSELIRNKLLSTQQLLTIAQQVLNGETLEEGTLSKWLKTTFKHAKPPKGLFYKTQKPAEASSRKKLRRQEYAIIQKLYRNNFSRAAQRVLANDEDEVIMLMNNKAI